MKLSIAWFAEKCPILHIFTFLDYESTKHRFIHHTSLRLKLTDGKLRFFFAKFTFTPADGRRDTVSMKENGINASKAGFTFWRKIRQNPQKIAHQAKRK